MPSGYAADRGTCQRTSSTRSPSVSTYLSRRSRLASIYGIEYHSRSLGATGFRAVLHSTCATDSGRSPPRSVRNRSIPLADSYGQSRRETGQVRWGAPMGQNGLLLSAEEGLGLRRAPRKTDHSSPRPARVPLGSPRRVRTGRNMRRQMSWEVRRGGMHVEDGSHHGNSSGFGLQMDGGFD